MMHMLHCKEPLQKGNIVDPEIYAPECFTLRCSVPARKQQVEHGELNERVALAVQPEAVLSPIQYSSARPGMTFTSQGNLTYFPMPYDAAVRLV